jgi:hypothetical protein
MERKVHHLIEAKNFRATMEYVKFFAKIFLEHSKKIPATVPAPTDPMELYWEETGPAQISARALVDLEFILNDVSPLTIFQRENKEAEEDEEEKSLQG